MVVQSRISLPARSTPVARTTPTVPEKIQERIGEWRERNGVPGVSVSIRRAGTEVLSTADGHAELKTSRSLRLEDAMWAGSVTKTLTSALVLKLAEAGKLSLSDRVDRWYPELPHARDISIRMLLKQQSGIPDYDESDRFSKALYPPHPGLFEPWDEVTMVKELSNPDRTRLPDKHFRYSNSNYWMLGRIAEKTTGQPLADLMRNELFTPTGVTGARFDTGRGSSPVTAHEYTQDGSGGFLDQHAIYGENSMIRSVLGGAGGAVASASDLARVGESLLWKRGSGLSAPTRDALIGSATAYASGYGFGIYEQPLKVGDRSERAVGHNGAVFGASSFLLHLPSTDETVAITANGHPTADGLERLAGDLLVALRSGGSP